MLPGRENVLAAYLTKNLYFRAKYHQNTIILPGIITTLYMNAVLKKALPHLIAIAAFVIVAVVYCRPALEGKVVDQSDVDQWKAMARQSYEYKEKYGHFPLWVESDFS